MFHLDFEGLITGSGILLGLAIIGGIIFAESGLLVGFFLPGDTLLLFAGFFAAQGKLPLGWLLVTIVVCAIIGDNVGYSIGRRTGPRIFKKKDGLFFHKDHIERAEKFYNQHGGKTIILARFVPIVRTFAPMVAGIGKMPRKRFMAFNVVGAFVWGVGVTMIGYFLGGFFDPATIEKFILPVMLIVTAGTFGPALYHLLKEESTRQAIKARIKLGLSNIFLNKKID
jgi:membrane-associated protein